jgi:hypothetical protein
VSAADFRDPMPDRSHDVTGGHADDGRDGGLGGRPLADAVREAKAALLDPLSPQPSVDVGGRRRAVADPTVDAKAARLDGPTAVTDTADQHDPAEPEIPRRAELRPIRGTADFASGWADDAYDTIRAADDVDAVTESAREHGFSRGDIQQVKDHLFYDQHLLDRYPDYVRTDRFDANPRIAEAWDRLTWGHPHESDIELLRHELYESTWMIENNSRSYNGAHQATLDAGLGWDAEAAARDGLSPIPE